MTPLTLVVNGKEHAVSVPGKTPLLWVLRDALGLSGTKFGCGMGLCGACTVHLDGKAVRACLTDVDTVGARAVTTIEGLSADRSHPLQQAWLAEDVSQCGYCQPGQLMSARRKAEKREERRKKREERARIQAEAPPADVCTGVHIRPGDSFERWTVLEGPLRDRGVIKWKCRCQCGTVKLVVARDLVIGDSRSCGCLAAERTAQRHLTHGESKTRRYRIWKGLMERCYNPNQKSYAHYGAKGVTVCPEWMYSYPAFRAWAVANGYRDDLSIDRIDPFGNYEPGNCRWIPLDEQPGTRCYVVRLEAFGESKRPKEWALDSRARVSAATIRSRVSNGWTVADAITVPLQTGNIYTAFGEDKTAREWADDERCRVGLETLATRLGNGWSPEDAISTPTPQFRAMEVVAWGECRSLRDWAIDPRSGVGCFSLYQRLEDGWDPEEAISTPPPPVDQQVVQVS